ncbi:hypothetical protein [Bartonella sp. HY038]|uniref:hypothetical protein n=1 Tax=Bartonella sp. HY038 TaxID=2759660 RepID=UPI0015FE5A15|nr:hypothetical protein [Bartonella sp. HY038]
MDNVRKSGGKNDDDGDGPRYDYSDRTVKVNEGTPDEKIFEYNSEGESKDVKEFFKESDNYNAGSGVRTYDSPHAWCAAFVHYCFKKSKVKGYSPPKTGKDEYIVSSPLWQRDWGDVANPPCLGAVAYRIENHMGFIVGKGMAITNTRDEIRKYNKEIKAYLAINKKLRTNKDCPKPLVPKEQMCYFLLGGNQSQEVNITPFPIGDINIKKIQVPKGYKWCKKDEQLEDTKWVKYWYSQNPDRTVKGFTTR